jgi:phage-related minor tail protein
MDNALRQFVRTGKLNFADLIRSMVQELMYLESKAKLMDIMKSLKGSSGGGIMGMLGGLMGGGEAPVMLASGGPLDANQLAIVGEQGPELFMPSGAGTIIPTNNLASALGGGGQTINYNGPYIASMSAIDTQTGVQFLAKNKQTIWASYQSANRSVPVSR